MNGNIKAAYYLVAVLILIGYTNTLFNGYSLDDELVTGPENVITRDLSNVKAIFTEWFDTQLGSNYEYRPIVKLSYAIENSLFGLRPGIHHFLNLVYYFFCCIFLLKLLSKLLPGKHFFVLTAILIFTAHPIHTEVVASLKNRDILLAFLFGAGASLVIVTMFDKGRFPVTKILLVILLFYLAMLSKRDALTFAFILPPVLWLRYDKFRVHIAATFFIIAGAYILLLLTSRTLLPQGESSRALDFFENPLAGNRTMANKFTALLNSAGFYLIQNFFPLKQVSYYGYNTIDILKPASLHFIFGGAGILAGIFAFIKSAGKNKTLAIALCFLFGGMVLYLNAIKPVPGIVADRFTFMSSIGASLIFALLLEKIFRYDLSKTIVVQQLPAAFKITTVVLLLVFSSLAIFRNSEWKDKETLFSADALKAPQSAKMHSLYALELIRQYRELSPADTAQANAKARIAISELRQSLKIYPQYTNAKSNLGYLLLQLNSDLREVLPLLQTAAQEKKDNAEIQYNYANALYKSEKYTEAEDALLGSLNLKKKLPETYLLLMQLSDKTRNHVKIASGITKNLSPELRTEAMYTDIGNLFARGQDTLSAVNYYDSAVTVNPVNRNMGGFLYRYYKSKGQDDKAERIRRMFPANAR